MTELTNQELLEIEGGNEIKAFFFALGYVAGRNFDFGAGVINGFIGYE